MISIHVQAFLYESRPELELVHSVCQSNWAIVFQPTLIIFLVPTGWFQIVSKHPGWWLSSTSVRKAGEWHPACSQADASAAHWGSHMDLVSCCCSGVIVPSARLICLSRTTNAMLPHSVCATANELNVNLQMPHLPPGCFVGTQDQAFLKDPNDLTQTLARL